MSFFLRADKLCTEKKALKKSVTRIIQREIVGYEHRKIISWLQFLLFESITKPISHSAAIKILCKAQPYISLEHDEILDLRISYNKIRSNCVRSFESAHSDDGLHQEAVGSSCEDRPGGEEHMCVFYVVGPTGRGVTLL